MSDWRLIYSTNATGAAVEGSVGVLVTAVRAAADVKILYSPSAGVWWSRYCSSVTTRGAGNSALVAAIYVEAADTTQGASGLEFNEPFALEYHIYNSNGVRKVFKIDHQMRQVIANQSDTIPMRWYVRDYQPSWFPVADVINDIFDRASP